MSNLQRIIHLLFDNYGYSLNKAQSKVLGFLFKEVSRTSISHSFLKYYIDSKIKNIKSQKDLQDLSQSINERLDNIVDDGNTETLKNVIRTTFQLDIMKYQYDKLDQHFKSLNSDYNRLNEQASSLKTMRGSIYTDLVTILGIFVAIIVAVFGGFQSLGNLFENVDKIGLGKAISLDAVALFGVYLILILLFQGISKLTHQTRYQISIKFNAYLIVSFVIVFLLGILC